MDMEIDPLMEFQCLLCGSLFDGYLHTKPDSCPYCDGPENMIVDAQTKQQEEDENRRINLNDMDKE